MGIKREHILHFRRSEFPRKPNRGCYPDGCPVPLRFGAPTAVAGRRLALSSQRSGREQFRTTPGNPVTQWVYICDNYATNDAAMMAAPGLDTSTWTNVTVGTDVFNGTVGYAWFRSIIIASELPYQPVTIYFFSVDDNAWVYLNGVLIGQHQGRSQAFSISPLNPA